jgi:hypothetical protein
MPPSIAGHVVIVGVQVAGGRFVSEPTQEARSSSMYSSAFSCGVSAPEAHPAGVVETLA